MSRASAERKARALAHDLDILVRGYGKPFGQIIESLLRKKGWSQSQLAREMDVTQPVVHAILRGKMRLPPARIDRILEALDVPEGRRRPYCALHAISTIPAELREEAVASYVSTAFAMITSLVIKRSLEYLDSFACLPGGAALLAGRVFLLEMLDRMEELEAVDETARESYATQLDSAQDHGDLARIVAGMATEFMCMESSIRQVDALGRLVALTQDESMQRFARMAELMVKASTDTSAGKRPAKKRRRSKA